MTCTPEATPSAASRFFRAARAHGIAQLLGEYDETAEQAYETARAAMLRVHTIERVDAVDDLAFRSALGEVR